MVTGVEIEQRDDVVHAVIDIGQENALTGEICAALTTYLTDPPPDAHVFVLSARGPAFCLGRQRQAETPADLRTEVTRLVDLNEALPKSRLLTVAQVHGDAAGFGVGLAALCDLTIASADAEFWFPEVEMGLAPAVVLAWLPRIVGYRNALHLAATGRKVGAGEALDLGLVSRVVPEGASLTDAVTEEVTVLTKHSPRVHAEIKEYLHATADLTAEQANSLAKEKLIIGSMRRGE